MARAFLDSDLSDLVNAPSERLDVEYKAWVDIDQPHVRASLARHIAALSNLGGGFIVFGFEDKTHVELEDREGRISRFDHDSISAIVKKFLTPAFECQTRRIKSATGTEHAIIWVPSHGGTPTISKSAGPPDDRGKPREILENQIYVLQPGPESAQVRSTEQWQLLVRRCVQMERDALLSLIAPLLQGQTLAPTNIFDSLKAWHTRAHDDFEKALVQAQAPTLLRQSHIQFSYQIVDADARMMDCAKLFKVLQDVAHEVTDTVNYGWTAFYPFQRRGIETYTKSDVTFGEFLETNLMGDPDKPADLFDHPDFWRVSPDGHASLLRGYFSDRSKFAGDTQGFEQGKWISPRLLSREILEIVRHARGLASRYPSATGVRLVCECFGIENREIRDIDAHFSPGKISRDSHRIGEGQWTIADLVTNWPEITADLMAPIMRAFDPRFIVSAETIRKWSRRFK